MTDVIRRPAVAGYYYPEDPEELRNQLRVLAQAEGPPEAAHAVIVPHGSFRHSGRITGQTLARVRVPRRCLVVSPSHAGSWGRWRIMLDGAYRTPLGDVPIDRACAAALHARCQWLDDDPEAQRGEHGIEVQLPFLQWLGPARLTVVPLLVGAGSYAEYVHMGHILAHVIRMQEEPVLLMASSDLSHYEPEEQARRQDQNLLAAITSMESEALRQVVEQDHLLMCGYGAVVCVLEAAKALGATRATLAAYGTSAEAGGDPHAVIGYAGCVIQ